MYPVFIQKLKNHNPLDSAYGITVTDRTYIDFQQSQHNHNNNITINFKINVKYEQMFLRKYIVNCLYSI